MLVVAPREHYAQHGRQRRFHLPVHTLLINENGLARGAITQPVTVRADAIATNLSAVREMRVVDGADAGLAKHANIEIVLHFSGLHATIAWKRRQRFHRVIAEGGKAHGILRKTIQLKCCSQHRLRHIRLRKQT